MKRYAKIAMLFSLRANGTSPSNAVADVVVVVAAEYEFGLAERKNLIMCKVCICFTLLLYLHRAP